MSLEFLNLKSFHPGSKENQKRLFIAEQKAEATQKREIEKAKERKDEIEYYKNKAALGGFSKLEAERSKVSFLYSAPPGAVLEKEKKNNDSNNTDDNGEESNKKDPRQMNDVEKFPFLANAPVQGGYTSDIKVTHKPFGIELRDVRCIRCQQWGHKSGDRDCPLKDINPNDLKRLQREDPMLQSTSSYSNNNTNDDEDDEDDDSILREFLESLTKRQRKLLLRQIKKEEKQKKKKERKEKRKKKRSNSNNSDSSDSDSSDTDYSSSSDSEDDRKSRKSKKKSRTSYKDDDDYVERTTF